MESTGLKYLLIYVGRLLFSLFISLVITISGVFILSFLLLKYHFSEEICKRAILAIYGISAFTGGYSWGSAVKRYEFINGILAGIIYYFCMITFSLMCNNYFSDTTSGNIPDAIIKLLLVLVLGCMGARGSKKWFS